MIELEIQTLSETREGLLIEIGRCVLASGFTLQRQRLVQDPHGVLMTMVVRGHARKRRALEAALGALERIISFQISPWVEGESKAHFAASRPVPWPAVVPAPAPVIQAAAVAATAARDDTPAVAETLPVAAASAEPASRPEPEPESEYLVIFPPAPSPTPAPAPLVPYVERIPLGPEVAAVELQLPQLIHAYPHIFPLLLALGDAVAEAARESSLALAGQRLGAWVYERQHASGGRLALREAIGQIAVPALRALVEIEQQGDQLHIRRSPLCASDGPSGCRFFSGYLEGLLGATVGPDALSIFAVCCRSCGADECVLALASGMAG